jgi:hypothetical protein
VGDVEDPFRLVQARKKRRGAPELSAGADPFTLRDGARTFGELLGAEQLAAYGPREQLGPNIGCP